MGDYKYNARKEIAPEMMKILIRQEIKDDQWSTFRGKTIEEQITITRRMQPIDLDLVIELAHRAFEEVKRAPGANCDLYTDHWQDVCKMYANARGGGYIAAGAINGNPIGWHTYHHRVGIVLTKQADWFLIDVAFASRPNPIERFVYPITFVDDEFNKLEMP